VCWHCVSTHGAAGADAKPRPHPNRHHEQPAAPGGPALNIAQCTAAVLLCSERLLADDRAESRSWPCPQRPGSIASCPYHTPTKSADHLPCSACPPTRTHTHAHTHWSCPVINGIAHLFGVQTFRQTMELARNPELMREMVSRPHSRCSCGWGVPRPVLMRMWQCRAQPRSRYGRARASRSRCGRGEPSLGADAHDRPRYVEHRVAP
jgi:hypothetical protein